MQRLPGMLEALAGYGFRMAHLPFFGFAAPWPPKPIRPEEALPPLEEVTSEMARYDAESAALRKVRASAAGLGD